MDYVCIVGGANVDICGTPYTPLKIRDSNPGRVTVSLGGVGRNIAENLARLKVKVVLITVLGSDVNAELIRLQSRELDIDLSHSLTVSGAGTSTYLCLNDSDNDMYAALSDMEILRELTPSYLESKLGVLNSAKCVIADTNIPHCLDFLQKNVTAPLFVDTVSAKKTELVKDKLFNVFCLKPNVYEAEILSGLEIKDEKSLKRAAEKILSKNVKRLYISNGEKGVYYFGEGVSGHAEAFAVDVKSTTGAGDSFMAGAVYAYLCGMDLAKSAEFGCGASALTIMSSSTVSSEMNIDNVNKLIERRTV